MEEQLSKALAELGPTGFPDENDVDALGAEARGEARRLARLPGPVGPFERDEPPGQRRCGRGARHDQRRERVRSG